MTLTESISIQLFHFPNIVECLLKHYVSNTECMHKLIHVGYERMAHSVSTGVTPSAQWFLFLFHAVISAWPSVALLLLYRLPKVQTQTQYVRQAFFTLKLLLKYQTTKNLFIWKDCPDGFLGTPQMMKRLERYWQLFVYVLTLQ